MHNLCGNWRNRGDDGGAMFNFAETPDNFGNVSEEEEHVETAIENSGANFCIFVFTIKTIMIYMPLLLPESDIIVLKMNK